MRTSTSTFEYKCRRCGEVFLGLTEESRLAHMLFVSTIIDGSAKQAPKYSLHDNCNPTHLKEGVGLGDLIGFVDNEE